MLSWRSGFAVINCLRESTFESAARFLPQRQCSTSSPLENCLAADAKPYMATFCLPPRFEQPRPMLSLIKVQLSARRLELFVLRHQASVTRSCSVVPSVPSIEGALRTFCTIYRNGSTNLRAEFLTRCSITLPLIATASFSFV